MYSKENWTIFLTGTGAVCKDIDRLSKGLPLPYVVQTMGWSFKQRVDALL